MKPALRLLPWLGLAALTGCSWEEDPATCLPETTSLQVTVSARQEGDLNSRADENAKDGEFMHDLCVLFVQNNEVKLKLQPDLSNDASASTGNLENWTSGEQKGLEAGTYTVYAFANISDHYGKWNVGTELSGDALPENIVIEDPAGNLDFENGKFIPMAAKETVEITAATRSVSIGLDRLVAKVRMTVGTTSQEPVTVKNVTFSGYADKVSLIPNASVSTLLRDKKYEYTDQFQISASQNKDIPDFYVNETRQGDPFTISVTTTENQGVTYLATTTRPDLPRNSIYPHTLNLNQSELDITAEVYLVAIGAAVEDCKVEPVEGQQDTYRLRIPAGGLFKMQLNNTSGITYDAGGCSWENDPANKYIALTTSGNTEAGGVPSVTGTTVWGYSSASNIYDEYPIYLTAKWTDGTNNFTRKYTILIATEDMFNFDYVETNTNANMASPLYLNKEYLNMFIKK